MRAEPNFLLTFNIKEYSARIEAAWGQPGDVGQKGRVADDKS